jgi:hypothetical protein
VALIQYANAVLIVIQLLPTAREAHFIYKVLTYGVIACYSLFNLIWLMGSEGSASLGLSQEVLRAPTLHHNQGNVTACRQRNTPGLLQENAWLSTALSTCA